MTDVEQIKSNGGFYFYSYPFGEIVQKSFHGGFYVPINQGSFLRGFLTTSELQVN
jgi:hypothetical protein